MPPFTGPPVFVPINIKPLVRMRVVGGFKGLETPSGKRNKELSQRIMANDARYIVRLWLA